MHKSRWIAFSGAMSIALTLGCAADKQPQATSVTRNPLYFWNETLPGQSWPGKTIPMCWAPAGTISVMDPQDPSPAIADEPSFASVIPNYLRSSWSQATGLRFSGWGVCPADPSGQVEVIPMIEGARFGFSHTIGYAPTGTAVEIQLGAEYVSPHELGHTLGFTHEEARPDDPSCGAESAPGGSTLNTPTDNRSVMEKCMINATALSYWDVVGSQNVYGRPDYFADVNGDGRADAIVVNPTSVLVRLSTGSGFGPATDWTGGAFYGQQGTFFADVNGDGKADAIAVNMDGAWVRLSTGSGFQGPALSWQHAEFAGYRATAFADVTGDGKADAIAVRDDGIWVMPSSGSRFAVTDQRWATSLFVSDYLGVLGTVFVDVNGDGKADAVVVNDNSVSVMLSTGSSFAPASVWHTNSSVQFAVVMIKDVTGDGRADYVRVDMDAIRVAPSTGTSFSSEVAWTASSYFGQRGTQFADVTGDGRADAIAIDETISVIPSTGTGFSATPAAWTTDAYYSTRALPPCVNGVRDGDETDVDCGGSCVPCLLGKQCVRPMDCGDSTCVSGICVAAATCFDGIRNGRETDIDCGGFCMPCADHKGCAAVTDCQSNTCAVDATLTPPAIACIPGNCHDGVRDTGETGIDCGGTTSCARCPNGQPCLAASDCASGSCVAGVCKAVPTCTDGVRNGKETDIDCGGADTCPRCADDHGCNQPTDCQSGFCTPHVVSGVLKIACITPSCTDGIRDGLESGIDCGGATTCPRCAAGITCTANSDCLSGSCVANLCH